jgi:hypothetical protein
MIDRIHKYALRVGLAINAKKTMFQYIGPNPSPTLSCGGTPLALVSMYMTVRVGQAWTQIRTLNKVWRSDAITTPNKILLFKTLILPILLYGTPTYALTESRRMGLQGAMTKMLRWIRGYHRCCKAPLYIIYEGCKHATTYANERTFNMLASTLRYIPHHPLALILEHTPTAKLTAGRFFLLRNQLQSLLQQLGEDPESRTAKWEHEAYEKARIRNEKTHLAGELTRATKMHPIDEDKPLAILPRYCIKQFHTISQRLDYLIAEGIAQESARTRLIPSWTCAYCAEDPQRSKLLTTRKRHLISRKDTTQAIINDCLREYPKTPITIT